MKQTAIFWLMCLASLAFATTIPASVNQYTEVGDSFFNNDGSPVLAPNCTMNIYFSNGTAYNATNFNMSNPNSAGMFSAKFNFTTNDTYNAQMNCTDQTGAPQAPQTIFIDAKTNAFIEEQTDSAPLVITASFIFIILFFFYLASKSVPPWDTLFNGMGGLTMVATLLVLVSFAGQTTFAGQLFYSAFLYSTYLAPWVAGAILLKLAYEAACKYTIYGKYLRGKEER